MVVLGSKERFVRGELLGGGWGVEALVLELRDFGAEEVLIILLPPTFTSLPAITLPLLQ